MQSTARAVPANPGTQLPRILAAVRQIVGGPTRWGPALCQRGRPPSQAAGAEVRAARCAAQSPSSGVLPQARAPTRMRVRSPLAAGGDDDVDVDRAGATLAFYLTTSKEYCVRSAPEDLHNQTVEPIGILVHRQDLPLDKIPDQPLNLTSHPRERSARRALCFPMWQGGAHPPHGAPPGESPPKWGPGVDDTRPRLGRRQPGEWSQFPAAAARPPPFGLPPAAAHLRAALSAAVGTQASPAVYVALRLRSAHQWHRSQVTRTQRPTGWRLTGTKSLLLSSKARSIPHYRSTSGMPCGPLPSNGADRSLEERALESSAACPFRGRRVKNEETVKDLKERVAEKSGVPLEALQLFFLDRELTSTPHPVTGRVYDTITIEAMRMYTGSSIRGYDLQYTPDYWPPYNPKTCMIEIDRPGCTEVPGGVNKSPPVVVEALKADDLSATLYHRPADWTQYPGNVLPDPGQTTWHKIVDFDPPPL
eukprot:scaffold3012_cov396-Prasinococcus_capsulatus_cf.AAC.7